MKNLLRSWRGWGFGLLVLLGVATAAYAQFGGMGGAHLMLEYTMQEVQPPLLVQTMNDLSKERWEIFQVVPVWVFKAENGETDLSPKAYQIFARRQAIGGKAGGK